MKLDKVTWGNLYKFLSDCKCDCTLRNTKAFCKTHNIEFSKVKPMLEEYGGFCDCEVLLNVTEHLKGKIEDPP